LAFPIAPEYKPEIHRSIFQLCYFSEGAFTFDAVYDMPIYLRRFYTQELVKQKELENQQVEGAKGKSSRAKPPTRR
jgi:hypothetical protein